MIFDALSNAAYRVSLRGAGAEIEGGLNTPPPAGGGKSRGPAGRGLTLALVRGSDEVPRFLANTSRIKRLTVTILSAISS